jgi:hypothetical protein
MSDSSSMKNHRHIFRAKWPTIQITLVVLWTLFGLTESTEFETTRNVCWLTAWNETLPNSTSAGNETLDLSEIYQEQFEQTMAEGNHVILLPSCLTSGRFSLSMETISTPVSDSVYAGEAQFRFQMNAVLSDIDERFSLLDSPSVAIWFRVLACNVHEISFCHPFVDMEAWGQQSIPVSTDLSQPYSLTSHEENDGVISSQWLEVPPINFVGGDDALRLETLSTLDVIIPDVNGVYEFVGK